jgi:hypothetical protein
MTGRPKKEPTIIVCARCKRERKQHGKKGMCKSCHCYLLSLERHENSPLKKCECSPECPVMIKSIQHNGMPNKYANGHNGKFNRGKKNGMFKQGFQDLTRGYRYLLFRDHPFCNSRGYIMFHRVVYEMFHKCCLLPWADVHHLDENVRRNHPENLQGLLKSQHSKLTRTGRRKKRD